jgi:hypothetical protein
MEFLTLTEQMQSAKRWLLGIAAFLVLAAVVIFLLGFAAGKLF